MNRPSGEMLAELSLNGVTTSGEVRPPGGQRPEIGSGRRLPFQVDHRAIRGHRLDVLRERLLQQRAQLTAAGADGVEVPVPVLIGAEDDRSVPR